MTYRTPALCFGAFFTVAAFTCLLISVCTSWWIVIQIDTVALKLEDAPVQLAYLTRNRGLFKECFSDTKARALIKANRLADSTSECLHTDFSTDLQNVAYSSSTKTRSDLMTAEIVFLCLALVLCVCSFCVFCYGAYLDADADTRRWELAIKWAGILLFVTAFSNALGMALFHGAEYMETQVIESNDDQAPYNYFFTRTQPNALQDATMRFYHWSYALSWLAVFLELVAALILFLCGACCGQPRKREKMYYDNHSTIHSIRSYGHRNKAYEYAEGRQPQPAIIYPGHAGPVIDDGMYYDHFKGRHFDPYRGAPVPREMAPNYNYEEGGWKWH